MSFIWPGMLWLLGVVPLFVVLYLQMRQRRGQLAARHGSLGVLQGVGRRPGLRRHIPPALLLLALTILIVGLARPQAEVSLPRLEGTVILAFDVSASMAADDLQPTRMEAAKAAAQAFVQQQPSTVQIGVVAFSNNGLAVQVPTNDQAAILAAIQRLTPKRGTSLGQGILASLKAIAAGTGSGENGQDQDSLNESAPTPGPGTRYDSAVIVLLTDGENTDVPDPFEAAQAAADLGVRVYPVGLGSPAGSILKLDGFTVVTQLDEPALRNIAQLTKGTYYNAQDQQDLPAIYDEVASQLVVKPEQMEVTALLAGASVLMLLVAGTLSLLWFGHVP